jgi:methylmalonyl-CoA mutase
MTDPTPADTLALRSAEDEHTQADWEKSAAAVLRKAHRITESESDELVWDKLSRITLDGIVVPPIGTRANTAEAGLRPTRQGDWDIRPLLGVADAKAGNEAALVDLENGATSLWLRPQPDTDLATLLEGVFVDLAPVVLDARGWRLAAAQAYTALLKDRVVEPAEGTNLGADPIGDQLRGVVSTGSTSEGDLLGIASLAREAGTLGVVVDGTAVHDLGASDAQELGFLLAVGTAYLRELTDSGFAVAEAAALMEFRLAATDEQFPTIAKFRAARQLWARVAELSGLDLDKLDQRSVQRQHAVTSSPMMSKYDPWVNMLRTTVAAFAAGVGGAEAVTVQPFDSPLGMPDALGRRNARNTSSLLISESHVARVTDPAGGSYAVERLTHELCEAAWAEFQRIEQSGGIGAALEDRSLQGRIDQVVAVREAEIARRRRPLTGVTEFPNLGETLPSREEDPLADVVRRYGASFEALRDVPATSPVFLATMGTIAAHTARATFASNLFAAGGIAVEAAGATAGVDDVLKAYAGQPVVCLAGADSIYAEWGDDLIARLRDAGATWIIIAGKISTSSISEELVDDSCAMGVDALAFLHRTREKLA